MFINYLNKGFKFPGITLNYDLKMTLNKWKLNYH